MRILKRLFKIALLIILLVACALTLVRYFFADRIIVAALQRAGASDASVHLAAVNTDQIRFDSFTATFTPDNGTKIRIKAKQVKILYDIKNLIQTGKCNLLAVQEMDISRTGESKVGASPLRLPEKIILLKDSIRSRLPIKKIRLDRIVLHDNLPSQLKNRESSLTASVSGTAVKGTVTLQVAPETQITLNFRSTDAQHGTADIVGRRHGEEILLTKLVLQPDTLSGTVNLHLQPINTLFLRPLSSLITGTTLPLPDGILEGNFSLPLPLRDDAALHTAFTLADNRKHLIRLEASGNPDTKKVRLLLTGQAGKQEFLKTTLDMQAGRIKGSYTLHSALLRSFLAPYLPSPLPAISGTLSGTLDIPRPLPKEQEKHFKGTATASSLALPFLTASSARIELSGRLRGQSIHLDEGSLFQGNDIAFGKTKIRECSLGLAGDFSRTNEQMQIAFTRQQTIHLKKLQAGATLFHDLLLRPKEALHFALNKNTWSFEKNTLNIAPLSVKIGAVDISTGPLQCAFSALRCTDFGPEIITKLSTPTLVINTDKGQLPLKKIDGEFRLQHRKISTKLQFAPKSIPGRAQADIQHDLTANTGSFTLRTDKRLDLNKEGVSLTDLFTGRQFPFNLDKGTVFLASKGNWKPGKKFHLTLLTKISKGSGYFRTYLFEGLDTRQELVLLPRLHSQSNGTVSVQRLISALDIHNLRAETALASVRTGPQPEIQLKKLQAEMLQGTISSPVVSYDLNEKKSDFTVNVRGVDLATLVNLMKIKSMQATGRISGDIPVTIRGKEISVGNGTLYNDQPGGRISYTAAEGKAAGLSEYALKIIRDFRYTSLKSTAQYAPDGKLNLAVSLQGISPELDSSRPVHFNINIEQNLRTLLQGLSYSKGLSEKLDKQMQQQYR